MNEEVKVSLQLVNGMLQYLGTRPYGEVFQIVQEIQLQAIPQVPTPDPAAEPQAAGLSD